MFSLYLTKMNINIDNFDISQLNPKIINLMFYLNNYLENNWKIQKKQNCYVLKKKDSKIYIDEAFQMPFSADICEKDKYIFCFLYNSLNNGWSMKKNKDEYIFIKSHQGKKEIFSNNYIHTFLKENFKLNLIK